jgi:hypothetical protein
VIEVVGILKSYGIVLDAYYKNLIYIAEHQFLVLFPFFKYFDGEVSLGSCYATGGTTGLILSTLSTV